MLVLREAVGRVQVAHKRHVGSMPLQSIHPANNAFEKATSKISGNIGLRPSARRVSVHVFSMSDFSVAAYCGAGRRHHVKAKHMLSLPTRIPRTVPSGHNEEL